MKIILASQSPRRRELLSLITPDFEIDVPHGEEACPATLPLYERPQFLALEKAREVALRHLDDIIIAADTAVFCDDKMLGKPRDEKEAREMLSLLSGRTHVVITGCAVKSSKGEETFSVSTEVEFYPLDNDTIDWYVKTGEPLDKAGAYGIQGRGAVLVRGIKGDYFNVVGLPVAQLNLALKKSI